MPYANIHWIKLEKRLLNDYRFYSMNEESQLIYVKLLMLAAETNNKIPKSNGVIKTALRSNLTENKIEECIKEIKANFPKFRENKGFYFLREWGNRCNWILSKELRRNSEGTPKDAVDKIRIDKIIKEYITIKKWDSNNKELVREIYKRNARPAKQLTLIAKDKDINALQEISAYLTQKGLSWTLETIIKQYPEWYKQKHPKTEFVND